MEYDFDELFKEGDKIFCKIVNKLNKISAKYIHLDNTYRREEDYKELCIALALADRIKGLKGTIMEIKKHLDLLGFEVKDKVTDHSGVVQSICFDLFGCIQADVRPKKLDKDGKMMSGYWLDVNRLEIVSKEPLMDVPEFIYTPNGPADKSERR